MKKQKKILLTIAFSVLFMISGCKEKQETVAKSTEMIQNLEKVVQVKAEPTPTITLHGRIISVKKGKFTILEAKALSSKVIVSSDEKTTIVYGKDTKFVLCTSSNGGITASYQACTSSKLKKQKQVYIEGEYEENNFIAQKVTIYNFE